MAMTVEVFVRYIVAPNGHDVPCTLVPPDYAKTDARVDPDKLIVTVARMWMKANENSLYANLFGIVYPNYMDDRTATLREVSQHL